MARRFPFRIAGMAVVLAAAAWAGSALAASYYVAPGGDDGGAGTLADPWASFARAAQAMVPGDTTFVRGGTYTEPVRPAGSGAPGLPLTWARYAAEEPVITDVQNCIDLRDRDHVVIDGFTCDGMDVEPNSSVNVGAAAWRGSYNEIRNSTFRHITQSGVGLADGHHNVVRDNTFEFIGSTDLIGGDAIQVGRGASNNLVAGNDMSFAGHNLVQITFTPYNIVRDNRFTNAWWKVMGVFGPEARRNIVEDNEFFAVGVPPGYSGEYPGAVHLKGPENLFRRNLFYDNLGWGIESSASEDASHIERNRIVHNVFHRNSNSAWYHHDIFGEFVGTTDSNVFANNIAFENGLAPFPLPDPSLQVDFQLNGDPLNDNEVFHNLIRDDQAGEVVIKVTGISQAPLAWWQSNYPQTFWGNIEGNPRFVDAGAADFALRPNSPAVDAGAFPTVTAGAGSGDTLVVADAGFFSDGYDLVPGDWIQLAGQAERAYVCRVDYPTDTLTLDRSLSWSAGQGVALAYEGDAPDLGAFERNLTLPSPPTCPELPPRPQCSDRIDNDGDGFVDFPDDPQCSTPAGVEKPIKRCGFGFEVAPALACLAWLRRRRRGQRLAWRIDRLCD
jgi:hypothetical protein